MSASASHGFNSTSGPSGSGGLPTGAGGPGGPPGGHGGPLSPSRAARIWRNIHYPQELWWAIACFIAVIALFQFASWVAVKRRARRATAPVASTDAETGGASATARRFSWRNLPSAIVNGYRVVAFRWTLNIGDSYTLNMAEVFVTCAYIIALFTWEFINTTNPDTGKKWDPSYTGNRAGVLASSQFPLITALGTKNNVISYITGISYDKLNYVHRMAARVAFVMLWLHGGIKIAQFQPGELDELFVRLGLVAMVAFSLLIIISIRPIRSRTYELFYFTHFATVLIFLLGGYFHAQTFRYGKWIWPSLLIWALDRALRLARVVYYNHLYFGFHKTANRLDASVELLSPHFVRLHIERPAHFSWTPGQTAFLIMPTVSAFPLEAHPFTIASVDSHYQLEGVKAPSSPTDEKKAGTDGHDAAPFWKELVFLVNIREGFTKRLAAAARKGEKVKVLVDGPYGFSPSLDADDAVVLVAGGSGVSFTLSTFLGVLSHIQAGKSRCRKVVFIWSIRDASHIEWISKALSKALDLAPPNVEIAIRIFVTAKTAAVPGADAEPASRQWNEDDSVHSSEGTSQEGKASAPSLLHYPAVQVAQGRPDLPVILREEVDANRGRMSVTVCGSQGIARACRAALRVPLSSTLSGGPSVVLHVESFGYA